MGELKEPRVLQAGSRSPATHHRPLCWFYCEIKLLDKSVFDRRDGIEKIQIFAKKPHFYRKLFNELKVLNNSNNYDIFLVESKGAANMKSPNGFARRLIGSPDNSNISTRQYVAHNSGEIAPNVLPPPDRVKSR